ncbi:MAG: ribosome small subunit-dependent GTPase A [SAR324 cluster bacterium]|nr:ribosome small subunit-dependent GTPase A [SAR324 cluster bacterium]
MSSKRTSHPESSRDGAEPSSTDLETLQGRVAAVYTGYYLVLREGREWVCKLRGRFRREARPVVGDLVDFLVHADGGGTISALHPRRTQLERRAAHRGRSAPASAQVLAANVDQLVIVASLREPPFRAGLVERLLVAAAMAGLTPLICINKLDLAERDELGELEAVYGALDIPVLGTAALQPETLGGLEAALAGKTSVLVGHSGVGKTSLLNALAEREMAVGEVAGGSKGLGRHTTSTARLIPLRGGAFAIDSPGVREFGLHGVAAADLARHYPDFRPFLGACRFGDCLHRGEPGCAIGEAVAEGRITQARYDSYHTLLGELEDS